MSERVHDLFAEYASAYAKGERPAASEFVGRAGSEADALAGLIDRFVSALPATAPTAADVAVFEARLAGESPLLRLRTEQGVTRDRLVDSLIERLGLDRAKREKVKRYYHELESGLLDGQGVSRRVWSAIAQSLGARVDDLVAWRSRPLQPAPVYLRETSLRQVAFKLAALAAASPAGPPPGAAAPQEQPDEIDHLFTGSSARESRE